MLTLPVVSESLQAPSVFSFLVTSVWCDTLAPCSLNHVRAFPIYRVKGLPLAHSLTQVVQEVSLGTGRKRNVLTGSYNTCFPTCWDYNGRRSWASRFPERFLAKQPVGVCGRWAHPWCLRKRNNNNKAVLSNWCYLSRGLEAEQVLKIETPDSLSCPGVPS